MPAPTPPDGPLAGPLAGALAALSPVDRLLLEAYRPRSASRLAELLTPMVGSRAEASRLCRAWRKSPLGPADPTPATLPTGEPLPPSTTPWGRARSPVPGVDLPAEGVLDLGWKVLARSTAQTSLFGSVDTLTPLRALTGDLLPVEVLEGLLGRWLHDGHALACVRLGTARKGPAGLLSEEEIGHYLEEAARFRAARYDERPPLWGPFKMLVLSGMAPSAAAAGLAKITPYADELPNGQWVPSHMRPSKASGAVLIAATRVPRRVLADALFHLRGGNKIQAIKLVREATGIGLREAKDLVESLDPTLGPDEQRRPPRRVEGAGGRTFARVALDRAIDELLLTRPLHWAMLASASVHETGRVRTMAVGGTRGGGFAMFFNPGFVLSLSGPELCGVLLHEVNHVILGHLRPAPAFAAPPAGEPEAKRRELAFRLACEVTANEYVSFPLPGAPVTLERLGLPARTSTNDHYAELCTRGELPELGEGDDRLWKLLTAGASEPDQLDEQSVEGAPWASQAVRWAAAVVGGELDRPTRGQLVGAGFEAVVREIEPEGLGELPWALLLRQKARGLLERVTSRAYPSRRAPERLGVVPGRRSRREPPAVLVAIDTSGSMGGQELAQVLDELGSLMRQGLRVACVQCDDSIREQRWLRPGERLSRVAGGGGTDLRPPFSPEIRRRYDPSLIVYFTDGYGVAPEAPPSGVEVLWVLTGSEPQIPARFGKVVCLRPRAERRRVKGA